MLDNSTYIILTLNNNIYYKRGLTTDVITSCTVIVPSDSCLFCMLSTYAVPAGRLGPLHFKLLKYDFRMLKILG